MAEKTYKMTAKASFSNPRIKGPRDGGAVLPGESFETDFLHAKELVANKLAEPAAGVNLDVEPTDAVDPHSSLSVEQHKDINDRRVKAKGGAPAPAAKGA